MNDTKECLLVGIKNGCKDNNDDQPEIKEFSKCVHQLYKDCFDNLSKINKNY